MHSNAVTLVYEVAPYPHDIQSMVNLFAGAGGRAAAASTTTPPAAAQAQRQRSLSSFFASAANVATQLKSNVEKKISAARLEQDNKMFVEHFYTQAVGLGGVLCAAAKCQMISGGYCYSGRCFVSTNALCFIQEEKAAVDAGGTGDTALKHHEHDTIKEVIPFTDIVSVLPSIYLATMNPSSRHSPPIVIGVPAGNVVPNVMQVYTKPPLRQIFQLYFPDNNDAVSMVLQGLPTRGGVPLLSDSLMHKLQQHVKPACVRMCGVLDALWLGKRHSATSGRSASASSTEGVCIETENDGTVFAPPHF